MADEASQDHDGGGISPHMRVDVLDTEVAQALDIVGAKWFAGRMASELASRKVTEAASRRGAVVRRKDAHPLVQWRIDYDPWREARVQRPETPVTQTVVLLKAFAQSLLKARAAEGLDRVVRRLRIDDEFLAALFEIEVACSYLNRGWSVEFVEPGARKAPDLKVINDKGQGLWVECKRRDLLTGRDQRTGEFWESLKDRLKREWEPTKTNVAVILRIGQEWNRAWVMLPTSGTSRPSSRWSQPPTWCLWQNVFPLGQPLLSPNEAAPARRCQSAELSQHGPAQGCGAESQSLSHFCAATPQSQPSPTF